MGEPDTTPTNEMSLRKRIFDKLYPAEGTSGIDLGILLLIVVNIVAIGLEYIPSLHDEYHRTFVVIEWVSSIIFTIEYVVRLWVCVENPDYRHPVLGPTPLRCPAYGAGRSRRDPAVLSAVPRQRRPAHVAGDPTPASREADQGRDAIPAAGLRDPVPR